MAWVGLQEMPFYAYHGVYPEENTLGQDYIVDALVQLDIRPAAATDDVSQTIDYKDLYALVQQSMQQPRKLLETLAVQLCQAMLQAFPKAEAARVCIRKAQPPIGGLAKHAVVDHTLTRAELAG